MSQELARITYDLPDATIETWREQFLPLVITDLDSKAQLVKVEQARKQVKSARVQVEHRRKALKADALEWGRAVDAEAKRITALLEPIETHLEQEAAKVENEMNRRREEALRVRLDRLAPFQVPTIDVRAVEAMSEADFDRFLFDAAEAFALREMAKKQEEARKAEELAQLAAERAAVAEERKKLDAEKAEQRKRQAELDAQAAAADEERARAEAARVAVIDPDAADPLYKVAIDESGTFSVESLGADASVTCPACGFAFEV